MPFLGSPITPTGENPKLEPIAICGMSCQLPGGVHGPSDLWKMLQDKRVGNTQKVPKSRFNIDAFLHGNEDRPGSFNIPGGYYLDGPPEKFDPTFFNLTPVEAIWLDPQQRRMLEVCYEAIESAGLTLDDVQGSNTGVFCGSFTADYQQMTFKDSDFRHNYAATGVDVGIISARIGNVFGFSGPSALINTACSSSVYAVHNACHALRARDCEAALVGGVNIIMTVDQHMNTANLAIMSPTNMCHTFDESADGYGRAEGAGALYLKRLDDAVRDGDVIRAVIRSSACNSNGKVPGYGITFPNVDGQEQVIRHAYKRAGLDPNKTAYFEVHGTGTPVGDPIEVRAVSRAMNDTRSVDKPLLLGAIKPNIGHSGAASGIFAIIKAALTVEKGFIPGVAGLKNLNPNIHEEEWNVRINKDGRPWPAGFESRRASVSSFGYGGTNAHVIIENVEALVPGYRHGEPKPSGDNVLPEEFRRPLLVTMSAHDKTTLTNNINAHAAVVDKYHLVDIVHTLSAKRNKMVHRGFAVATEGTASGDLSLANFKFGTSPKPLAEIGFIFTGQGAAWPTMGREAIKTFPVFRETIQKLDLVLRGLEHPPTFSLEHQLSCPAEESKLNSPDVAQSTLSAIEIAIVDVLASWGIVPAATIGHSAGEIAAAYAAGLISAPEAIISSYYRGYSLVKYGPQGGSMLAVGKGKDELAPYQDKLSPNLTVACENSPNSVTLSGPAEDIRAAKEVFDAEKVFARELKTGMAYHSPYMEPVAAPMTAHIAKAIARLDSFDLEWRHPVRPMMSTVFNRFLTQDDMMADYWAFNLTRCVKFSTGLPLLVADENLLAIGGFVEVGPHSALSTPFKQICQANHLDGYTYVPTIIRPEGNAGLSLLKSAGDLYLAGYDVDLHSVNGLSSTSGSGGLVKSAFEPKTIVDLPPYQWNYEKTFWAEPRASAEYRQLTHPRHDLLGRRILGLSDHSIAWRNVLRIKDVPWLEDHRLGGTLVFPSAGHLAVAIEAVRQHCEINNVDCDGVTLRDVELRAALIIPETDGGIEIQVRLTEEASSSSIFNFAVESVSEDGTWTIHSTGNCAPLTKDLSAPTASHPVNMDDLTQRHSGKTWNKSFARVGFEYGRQFGALDKIRTHGKYDNQAAGKIPIATESGLMQGESRYFIHPATVDSLLQLIIIAIHGGLYQEMPWGVIPIRFDEVTVRPPRDDVGRIGDAVAWLPEARTDRSRRFVSDGKLWDTNGDVVLDIKGLHTVAYEAALPPKSEAALKHMPYAGVVWQPDAALLELNKAFPDASKMSAIDAVFRLLGVANHKKPLFSAVVLDPEGCFPAAALLNYTSLTTAIYLLGPKDDVSDDESDSRIQALTISEGVLDLESLGVDTQDFVLVGQRYATELTKAGSIPSVKSLLGETGQAIFLLDSEDASDAQEQITKGGLMNAAVAFADKTMVWAALAPAKDAQAKGESANAVDLVYSPAHSASPNGLTDALTAQGLAVSILTLEEYISTATSSKQVILYNPNGNLLSAAEQKSFEELKQLVASGKPLIWLTSGVNQGQNPLASMVVGFLRVVREEDKSVIVSVLDYDRNETFQSVCGAIKSIVNSSTDQSTAAATESEYWLHDGIVHISRVVPNAKVNKRMIGDGDKLSPETLSKARLLRGALASSGLVFCPSALEPIGPKEVEIQVDALEYQKQDLQTAPTGPRVVSGTVSQVGADVQSDLQGKTIFAYTTNAYDTIVRVSEDVVAEIALGSALQVMRTLPKFVPALNALEAISGPTAGKTVLLISSSDGMIEAMIALSKSQQFTLAIVRDRMADVERSVLYLDASDFGSIQNIVKQAGSNAVIIADEFSSLSRSLWRSIPSGAKFILTAGASGSPDATPFNRGASFSVASISSTLNFDPASLGRTLRTAVREVQSQKTTGSGTAVITIDSFSKPSEIPMDASALVFRYGEDIVSMTPTAFSMRFSPEDVYLLVGCLGGLGRSLTTWMMEHGARHFAFISRSGTDRPEAAKLIKDITKAGAIARVFRGDAADVTDIKTVVDRITKEEGKKIKGVVHAAMVLNDTTLQNMTLEKWNGTLSPKVDGALALDEALENHDLDFFVMCSSISATAGQPGQSNYSAANAFLDNLAWARNLAGKPATTLVLPMILGIGVVAESDTLEDMISRRGLYGDNEREMLRGFAAAMSQPKPNLSSPFRPAQADAAVVMGLEPTRIGASLQAAAEHGNSDVLWMEDPRFAGLRALAQASVGGQVGGKPGSGGGGSFTEQVAAVNDKQGYDAALKFTTTHIMQKCSNILMLPVDSFEFDGKSPGAYGLDSMIGVELRNWLFKELRLNIAFQDLLATTLTFKALGKLVLKMHAISP
ncbi:hypothetical protein DL769_005371 [Monosporascus sp. CRB-8-3]|nr:hypothetical protein DL769_005371 [Monosporascus sp. CRB-8-3]